MKLLNKFSICTTVLLVVLLSACNTDENPCPGVGLEVEIDSANFTAQVKATGLEDLAFDLFINDVLVKSYSAEELDITEFDFEFEPGEYKVCIQAESTSCDQRIEGCIEFSIIDTNVDECLGLQFTKDQIDDYNYKFFAEFDGIDEVEYDWYLNGDLVDSEPLSDNRDNLLELQLTPGTHSICIAAETDECGEVEYCREIVVDEECVQEVGYEAEMENQSSYYFFADFDKKEWVKYKWYVNDEMVDIENAEGSETDHKLYWQFEAGTHNVCLVTDQDGCESVSYCEEIVVEQVCPETVYFDWEKENDFTYFFYADFEEKEHVKYKWYINDEQVDIENAEGNETDHKLFWQFDEGTYNICLVTDQEGCEEVEYCEEITVNGVDCVETSYTSELNEETSTYTFTANFEARDDVTYIWKVYINDDFQGSETRIAGSDDDHTFQWQMDPGVQYEICLLQDGGCLDQQTCNVFSVD